MKPLPSAQQNFMNETIKENEAKALNYQVDTGNLLRSREKEMSEIKDAYKEKHRKCQAWEKVRCLALLYISLS